MNTYIWSIDRALTGTASLGQGGREINGSEEDLHIPHNPRLGPHHQMRINVMQRTLSSFKYSYLIQIILWIEITMTRESSEPLPTTYGNTGQLFRPY